ncbi:hypothetical protein [Roseivirga pacifica]|uniref:hypothetical protein n=1 Tax=Roseivirga pacifica TaxID=1267423 RepID=UPI00209549F6|nr:hypothetical protein [Roseivirga pacifica]MCO6358289.1 hypothetical protein [Roseivirga pacifica]MCO6366247.1 hypothetical protein [Roseivirga pacifica]MCO6369202.1 hypothetical protein [Roseivirga pacifica]MCO6374020.1 hypothetical protein [Roseivirga pacifica]MCO6378396.1 hypothetical protein [Roseivirga pacifica]
MKNAIRLKAPLLYLCFILLLSFSAYAQDATDVVVMLNGEERKGKVSAINDTEVTFTYTGETLEYKIKRSEINKIVFASGRTQVINEKAAELPAPADAQPVDNPAARKGKMAILPFKVITNVGSIDAKALGEQIQADCANTIKEDAPSIQIIDPRVVNATLAKSGMSIQDLESMLPSELAKMLGVEHVVYGSYDIENTGTLTTGSSVTSYKTKKEDDKKKGTAFSSGSTTTSATYDSKITMDIYNDQGTSIYSVAREPFMAGVDNYHSTIRYLVRRAPFGSKAK